jgi:hypothetical protein
MPCCNALGCIVHSHAHPTRNLEVAALHPAHAGARKRPAKPLLHPPLCCTSASPQHTNSPRPLRTKKYTG